MRHLWSNIAVGVGLVAVGALLSLACRLANRGVKGKGLPPSAGGEGAGEITVNFSAAPQPAVGDGLPQADAPAYVSPAEAGPARPTAESGPAPVSLQPDEAGQCVWLSVAGQRVMAMPVSDCAGLKLLSTWLVHSQCLSSAEAAAVQGVRPCTVESYRARYAVRGDSIDLIDRRRFNAGQHTAYRLEPHKPALIRHMVLNVVHGQRTTERGLAEQVGRQVDDRSVGRYLHATGWRAAEAAGLPDEVAAYLDKVRQEAYWAGVAGQPLESVLTKFSPHEWLTPRPGGVGISLGVAHLAMNGAYASLQQLVGDSLSALRMGHTYLVYLLKSGGARVSQAKHFVWEEVAGLLIGCGRASATGVRDWLVAVAQRAQDPITVQRSNGQAETITRLQDYQEEAVAQRAKRGLIQGGAIYLDDYVNAIYRREPVAQAKHGTWARIVKAFRRHVAQDVDTGHAVTCPLGRSDVTPLIVLQQVVRVVQGGLARAGLGQQLDLVIVDRWWSVKSVFGWGLDRLKVLVWGKNVKPVRQALAEVSEEELKKHPITAPGRDTVTGQVEEKVVGYRLDTDLSLYELDQPVRGVVDWDGQPGSPKRVRLAVGIGPDEMNTQAIVDGLRFRQRVEILLKGWQRRLNLPAFGGGPAHRLPVVLDPLDEAARRKLRKNHKQVATRLANDQAKLKQVEQELEHVRQGQAPTNGGYSNKSTRGKLG